MKSTLKTALFIFVFSTFQLPSALADSDDRQDRRQERGRSDERQDRRDCRREEGLVGEDKRDCKQEEVRDGVRGRKDEE
jgi:hypothetical protein